MQMSFNMNAPVIYDDLEAVQFIIRYTWDPHRMEHTRRLLNFTHFQRGEIYTGYTQFIYTTFPTLMLNQAHCV